jgi:predicted transcriptional regulator
MVSQPWSDRWPPASRDPLNTALGRLEREVMDVVWRSPGQSVRDVQQALGRPIAYTTAMTTLDRLYKKGLVTRALVGRAFIYSAARSRDELTAALTADLLAGLLAGGSSVARPFLSNLVDAVGNGPADLLDELERLVRQRRQQPDPGGEVLDGASTLRTGEPGDGEPA